MAEQQTPLLTDPRSYESEDGDVLPVARLVDPVTPRPDESEYMMTQVDDNEVVSQTTRAIQKAIADQAIEDRFEATDSYLDSLTPDKKTLKDENLSVEEALKFIYKEYGFYPHDNEEKNSAQGIMARSDSEFPVVHYLSEVKSHQNRANTDDPARALRSIASSFEGYALQADMDAKFSRLFAETIANRPVNMNQKLSQNGFLKDLLDDEASKRTLVDLARRKEVGLFVATKSENPLGVKAGIDTLTGKDLDKRIVELLDTMQLSAVMQLNDSLFSEENRRFSFWKKQLQGARMHPAIRAQADKSLEKLDKLRPAHA